MQNRSFPSLDKVLLDSTVKSKHKNEITWLKYSKNLTAVWKTDGGRGEEKQSDKSGTYYNLGKKMMLA